MLTTGFEIKCSEEEKKFLRRLGGAVLIHWAAFTPEHQELLIQQATDMVDRGTVLASQMKTFVRDHTGGEA